MKSVAFLSAFLAVLLFVGCVTTGSVKDHYADLISQSNARREKMNDRNLKYDDCVNEQIANKLVNALIANGVEPSIFDTIDDLKKNVRKSKAVQEIMIDILFKGHILYCVK